MCVCLFGWGAVLQRFPATKKQRLSLESDLKNGFEADSTQGARPGPRERQSSFLGWPFCQQTSSDGNLGLSLGATFCDRLGIPKKQSHMGVRFLRSLGHSNKNGNNGPDRLSDLCDHLAGNPIHSHMGVRILIRPEMVEVVHVSQPLLRWQLWKNSVPHFLALVRFLFSSELGFEVYRAWFRNPTYSTHKNQKV